MPGVAPKLCSLATAVLIAAASSGAAAQAIPPGAVACGGCHPASGQGLVPPLAGMPAEAMEASLRAFRTGERPATVMDRIAKGFSEDEAKAIAEWFARAPQP